MGRKIDRCLWQMKGDFSSGSDLPIGELHRNEDRGLVTTGSAREFKLYKRTIAQASKQFNIYRGVAQLVAR